MDELEELLEGYGYAAMRWNTSTRADGLTCPAEYRYWRRRANTGTSTVASPLTKAGHEPSRTDLHHPRKT